MKFETGTIVKIIRCKENPDLVGKTAVVQNIQDYTSKVKVSFDDNWESYFDESDLEEVIVNNPKPIELQDVSKFK